MDRYGKAVPFFEPYLHFTWYPATKCVFAVNVDQPVSRTCFNMNQARSAARNYIASLDQGEDQ